MLTSQCRLSLSIVFSLADPSGKDCTIAVLYSLRLYNFQPGTHEYPSIYASHPEHDLTGKMVNICEYDNMEVQYKTCRSASLNG